jgi:glycosyltransferase involved in cell wall biosynthesis
MTGDAIFCVSRAVMENFPQIPSRLLKLLYNGIDTSSYQNVYYDLRTEIGVSPSTRIIGMIARVNLWKGQFYFLEIASMLKDKYPDLHFVMAGDAYPGYEFLYDDLEEAIRERGLEGAVTNLKFRQDVPELLSAMDIFVLPSILPDPLPTTVLEAMAAAKPVVATNHGGATEMVIDGDTGMLIPFDDVKRSFEVISGLLDSKELITKMGEAGKARVKQFFDKEKYLENFGKLVKQVIQTNQE